MEHIIQADDHSLAFALNRLYARHHNYKMRNKLYFDDDPESPNFRESDPYKKALQWATIAMTDDCDIIVGLSPFTYIRSREPIVGLLAHYDIGTRANPGQTAFLISGSPEDPLS